MLYKTAYSIGDIYQRIQDITTAKRIRDIFNKYFYIGTTNVPNITKPGLGNILANIATTTPSKKIQQKILVPASIVAKAAPASIAAKTAVPIVAKAAPAEAFAKEIGHELYTKPTARSGSKLGLSLAIGLPTLAALGGGYYLGSPNRETVSDNDNDALIATLGGGALGATIGSTMGGGKETGIGGLLGAGLGYGLSKYL